MAEMPGPACFFSVQMLSYNMHLFLTFYIDLLVELCVKCLLQKAVHALCSLCWLHKWGGLKAQLLHIAPGNARGSDVALIKVSRSVRAVCIMRGNAPWGVKGINGLRAFGAWHFCAGAKMPNVSIAVYVPPRALPWAMGNIWAYSPPQSFTGLLCKLVRLQQTFAGGSA